MRVATIATLLALVTAAPAAAHVGVKSYSPKRGATVARTLERVKVSFKGKVTDGHLSVRDSSGTKASIGHGKVVSGKRAVRARLKSGLAKGTYSASMSVLHDFPLSVRVPNGDAGSQLVFRAFQTYQRGERVAWTGAPDSDSPAPRVTLLAPEPESH